MARVKIIQVRVVTQFKDVHGHRLPSRKGMWDTMMPLMEADCPKCPPEPEPECDAPGEHELEYRYCPSCGKRLREE